MFKFSMRGFQKNNDSLKKVQDEIFKCKKCPLYKERKKLKIFPVVGEGNYRAKIIFIGEAPGANEAKTGHPFCGKAGKVLDYLLDSVNIKRKDIYITNILKDKPPSNRNPNQKEINTCGHYLQRQIEIIKPKVICSLGNFSTKYIFEKYNLKDKLKGISKIHGKVFESQDTFEKIKIIPFYHPAVALYNVNMKKILRKDFQVLKGTKKLKDKK